MRKYTTLADEGGSLIFSILLSLLFGWLLNRKPRSKYR